MSVEDFVLEQTSPTNEINFLLATNSKSNTKDIIEHLKKVSDPRYPDLKKDRHVFSFRNGVYISKYKKDEFGNWRDYFYRYGDKPALPSAVVACKYFDLDFNNFDEESKKPGWDWYTDIPTPNFQKIIDYQYCDEEDYVEICKWLYILIGKMIYPLRELDKWQILPFLLGQAGSGKSTITNVIRDIFDTNDVGTIENRSEQLFGLSEVQGKNIYILAEVKRNFDIDQAMFQKMISGEDVSLPRKYKSPIKVTWSMPGFMCANEVPGFGDSSGSISRRLLVFKYVKRVMDDMTDPDLEDKLKNEMALLIKKFNCAYLDATNKYRHKDIWHVVPKYFQKTKEALGQETNPMKHFLSSGKIEYGKDLYVHEKTFKDVFRDHCSENNLGRPKWTSTLYEEPFSMFGQKEHVVIKIKKGVREVYPRDQNVIKPHGTFIYGIDLKGDSEGTEEKPVVVDL